MLVFLLILAILLEVIHIILNYNEKARLIKKIPGPCDRFIVGNGLEIIVSPGELMKISIRWFEKWNNIHRFWSFPLGAITIYNPEDVEIITSTMKFNDKSLVYKVLTPWLRSGLLVSKGEKWQQRRKLLTPAFHFNILRQFYVILQENSQRLVHRLDTTDGESVDITPILSEFTLNSICETAMGTQLSDQTSDEAKSYKAALYNLGKVLLYRFARTYLFPDFIFGWTAANRSMKKYLKVVHGFTERVIKDRREYVNKYGVQLMDEKTGVDDVVYKQKRKTAMLDLLLLAEKDGHIDNAGIQEEVDTFMFEGHDTTASGLSFCLMTLANNKAIQDKIFDQLQAIFGDSTRPASLDDLSKMKYLDCCIKESLRLYPPVHFISRHLPQTVTLSGYTVPANTLCHINILGLHRSPHVFKDPMTFDPDRFLPENSIGRHAYAYIPFSAGPRNCIGQKFAIMELKSAISEILRKFILIPVTRPEDIEFTADLVLRNLKPIYVIFAKR